MLCMAERPLHKRDAKLHGTRILAMLEHERDAWIKEGFVSEYGVLDAYGSRSVTAVCSVVDDSDIKPQRLARVHVVRRWAEKTANMRCTVQSRPSISAWPSW